MLQAQVNYWTLMEQKRHNLESERLGYQTLDESKRHSIVTENLGYSTLDESIRHSTATESISWYNASENARHNRAVENEQYRHDKRGESIASYEAGTSRLNAYTRQDELDLHNRQLEWDKFSWAAGYGQKNRDLDIKEEGNELQGERNDIQRTQMWLDFGSTVGKTIAETSMGAAKIKGGKK